jgi:hypothetical protein
LAIVSDHGFLPVSRVLKPNVLLREAGLIEVDAKGKITGWRAAFHVNGGSAGLRLRDPNDEAARARVRALLQERLAEPGSGLRAVLEPADIERFGGSADWLLALDARDGFYFSGLTAGAWSEPSASRGYHGYAPDRAAMHASFVVSAPGLTRRGDLGTIRMTIIAPTLARWLGVTLGPQADEPLPLFDEPGTRRETRH